MKIRYRYIFSHKMNFKVSPTHAIKTEAASARSPAGFICANMTNHTSALFMKVFDSLLCHDECYDECYKRRRHQKTIIRSLFPSLKVPKYCKSHVAGCCSVFAAE